MGQHVLLSLDRGWKAAVACLAEIAKYCQPLQLAVPQKVPPTEIYASACCKTGICWLTRDS